MKLLLVLLFLSLQASLDTAHAAKPLDEYLTTKDADFREITVRKALEQIFDQMGNSYSIVIPANDPELVKSFEEAKITLKLKAGIPYEELIRQVFLCGGFNYKYDGMVWRVLNEEQACIELSEFWTRTFRITKKEYEALGM